MGFKGTFFWSIFNTRSQLINEIRDLRARISKFEGILKTQIWYAIHHFEELDDSKIYYVQVDNDEDAHIITELINNIERGLPWKLPTFLIFTSPIKSKEVDDTMYRFVMSKRYIKFLIDMEGKKQTVTELSKVAGMSLQHLYNVTKQFIKEGILRRIDENKEVYLELTSKGNKVVKKLLELQMILEGDKDEPTQNYETNRSIGGKDREEYGVDKVSAKGKGERNAVIQGGDVTEDSNTETEARDRTENDKDNVGRKRDKRVKKAIG